MADKHGESESFKLRTEICSLASKRLEAISSKSRREEIFKVLSKRRKKWRRRHGYENTSYRPVDPSLREEKELLSDELVELKDALMRRRKEGFTSARQLQRETDSLCVQILRSRLESACARLSSLTSCNAAEGTSQTKEQSSSADIQETLTKDLESVVARATTLSEIKSMKFGMTPRVPPLHKRTLTSNPLEQSLGLFDGSEDLHVSSVMNVTTTDECNMEEVGVGQSWASFEGLATGSTSNGLSNNLRRGGTRDPPCGGDVSPDRKNHTPEPLDSNDLSSPKHTGMEEVLACDLQVVREEQVPAVAHTVEGTLEGLSYVTTLSHWQTTPPPTDTDTEEREEEEEVMEEEEVVAQTTDTSEEDRKLIEVLRSIERGAPWELRSRKK